MIIVNIYNTFSVQTENVILFFCLKKNIKVRKHADKNDFQMKNIFVIKFVANEKDCEKSYENCAKIYRL